MFPAPPKSLWSLALGLLACQALGFLPWHQGCYQWAGAGGEHVLGNVKLLQTHGMDEISSGGSLPPFSYQDVLSCPPSGSSFPSRCSEVDDSPHSFFPAVLLQRGLQAIFWPCLTLPDTLCMHRGEEWNVLPIKLHHVNRAFSGTPQPWPHVLQ